MNIYSILIAAGGLAVAVLSLILAFSQKRSADIKQDKENAKEYGKTSEILRTVNENLKKLDDKTTKSEARMEGFFERLIRVEESTKSAHHRIDGLENK